MGCCSGKQEGTELQFKDLDQYETQLTHNHKSGLSPESEPTQPSGSSEIVSSERNISIIRNSSAQIEPNYDDQKGIKDSDPNKRTIVTLSDPYRGSNNWEENVKSGQQSTVFSPSPSNTTHSNGQVKQKRLFHVVNGTQLRIRFGPLSTIHEEESQIGDTAKLSQASRKQFSHLDFSNFPNE